MIYLDYQATTPLAPEARDAMLRWLDGPGGTGFGNPHSPHRMGRQAKAAIELAREQVAALFPAGGKVIFTGTPEFGSMNPLGTVHGGWYGTLLDSCMACAVMTRVPKGSVYTTLEYKVNILRPIRLGMAVRATGWCQHAGRSTGIANGEIRGIEDDRLYATGSTTCIIMKMG